MKILPPESLGTFFEEARRSGVFELYCIDLATGLRRGELLGLKWSDIDLSKGIIRVRRQVLRQNGKVVKTPLKTKNSYHNIAIGADAIKVLKGMEQKDEYFFTSPYGGPMSPDSVLHMLQQVLKRAGLEWMGANSKGSPVGSPSAHIKPTSSVSLLTSIMLASEPASTTALIYWRRVSRFLSLSSLVYSSASCS